MYKIYWTFMYVCIICIRLILLLSMYVEIIPISSFTTIWESNLAYRDRHNSIPRQFHCCRRGERKSAKVVELANRVTETLSTLRAMSSPSHLRSSLWRISPFRSARNNPLLVRCRPISCLWYPLILIWRLLAIQTISSPASLLPSFNLTSTKDFPILQCSHIFHK